MQFEFFSHGGPFLGDAHMSTTPLKHYQCLHQYHCHNSECKYLQKVLRVVVETLVSLYDTAVKRKSCCEKISQVNEIIKILINIKCGMIFFYWINNISLNILISHMCFYDFYLFCYEFVKLTDIL